MAVDAQAEVAERRRELVAVDLILGAPLSTPRSDLGACAPLNTPYRHTIQRRLCVGGCGRAGSEGEGGGGDLAGGHLLLLLQHPPAPALLLMLLLAETAVRLAQQMRVGPCMPAGIEV